ncbi:MAG: biopolymer transporter ExbD [Bacteroidota bacterium]
MAEVSSGGGGGGHKKGGKVRSKKQSTKIDMTPMVDLAFLLLTFFMLATTFNKPKTMELVMPEKPNPNDPAPPKVNEKNVMTILLAKNNKVVWYIGSTDPQPTITSFSATGIRKVILEKSREIGKKFVILIKPSDVSTYKNVVDILDEMSITNARSFAIVDMAPADIDLLKAQSLY